MASEKEDLVRRFMEEAWSNRDLSVALACAHPEIELDWSASVGPFADLYHGHEGLARFWDGIWDAFDEFMPQIEESIDCGQDRLITADLIHGRGKVSGVQVNSRGAVLWTFRDAKIARARLFQTRGEALDAAGLTPDARSERA